MIHFQFDLMIDNFHFPFFLCTDQSKNHTKIYSLLISDMASSSFLAHFHSVFSFVKNETKIEQQNIDGFWLYGH
mgnify:CR=1 FL=1